MLVGFKKIFTAARKRNLTRSSLIRPASLLMIGIGLFSFLWAIYFSFWPMQGYEWQPGFSLEHLQAFVELPGILVIFLKTLTKVLILATDMTEMAFSVAWYSGQKHQGRKGALSMLVAITPFWTILITTSTRERGC